MSNDQLQFIDYRKPKLEAGDYQFTTSHRYRGEGSGQNAKLNLRVTGERVKIGDDVIFACYPPPGESGNFADTIPHISFRKGTLPWIRSAYSHDDESGDEVEIYEPWLYLMVVNENDLEDGLVRSIRPRSINDLNSDAYFPSEQLRSLKEDATLTGSQRTINTVDIKQGLFRKLLLNDRNDHDDKDQLEYLAHVRRRWGESGQPIVLPASAKEQLNEGTKLAKLGLPGSAGRLSTVSNDRSWLVQDSLNGDLLLDVVSDDGKQVKVQKLKLKRELSVLMANRFAQNYKGKINRPGRNIAMVVSLEKYLTEASLEKIDHLNANRWMRFMVLTSWEFESQPVKINFEQRSKALNANAFRYTDGQIKSMSGFKDKLESGLVPLPHTFRNNDRGLSWYRGPLVPTVNNNWKDVHFLKDQIGTQTATDADRLLLYHAKDGMMDISYAAAYELGRVLSLQNPDYLKNLRQYKKTQSRYIKLMETDKQRMARVQDLGIHIEELPYAQIKAADSVSQLEVVKTWLIKLSRLSQIPSWYLVPDLRLLPPKSLRTFNIDPAWIQALWLGALSLDGRAQVTELMYKSCWQDWHESLPRSGAFLNSDIVWAYPDLMAHFRNIDEQAVDIDDDLIVSLRDLKLNHFTGTSDNLNIEEMKEDFEDQFTDLIEKHPPIEITDAHQLQPDLTLYLTKKPFDYVSFALPPESLHYGTDFDGNRQFTKGVKFKGTTAGTFNISMTDANLAIINASRLATDVKGVLDQHLKERIDQQTDPDQKAQLQGYKNGLRAFKSARIGRFMLEGEPKVEFTVGQEKSRES
ncbi:MAG: hypothetical protein R8G66_22210 [Cytophagales bacterium]|nr:hypothetical protein [Cytophagales bacterium]